MIFKISLNFQRMSILYLFAMLLKLFLFGNLKKKLYFHFLIKLNLFYIWKINWALLFSH